MAQFPQRFVRFAGDLGILLLQVFLKETLVQVFSCEFGEMFNT